MNNEAVTSFDLFVFTNKKSKTLLYSSQKNIGLWCIDVYIIEKQPFNLAVNQFFNKLSLCYRKCLPHKLINCYLCHSNNYTQSSRITLTVYVETIANGVLGNCPMIPSMLVN